MKDTSSISSGVIEFAYLLNGQFGEEVSFSHVLEEEDVKFQSSPVLNELYIFIVHIRNNSNHPVFDF